MFKNFTSNYQLTVKARFILILATLVFGFSLFGLATFKAMSTLKVNGPVYQQIVRGKDVIADVLPPPEYIIESYMIALQLTVVQDFDDMKTLALLSRFKQLKAEYEERHKFWLTQPLDPKLRDLLLEQSYRPAQAFYTEAEKRFLPAIQSGDRDAALASFQHMRGFYDEHRKAIDEVANYAAARNTEDEHQAKTMNEQYNIGLLAIFSSSVAIAIILTLLTSRGILRSLNTVQLVAGAIADGNLNSGIDVDRRDEIGDLLRSMNAMQDQLQQRITAERKAADETLRVKIALDNVSTGVMIADNERNIVYANKSVLNVLKKNEAVLSKQIAKFSADSLVGANIDDFHANPGHQAQILGNLTDSYQADLELGGRSIVVLANPVVNELGQRLGTVVEWSDRTEEVTVENEVASIVGAAASGDFGKRLDLNGKEGFFRHLGEDINRLIQTSESGLNEIARVLNALSGGDLTQTIVNDYQGTFGQLKDDSNITVEKLKAIIGQIKEASDSISTASKEIAAGNNDLSYRTEQQAASLEQTAASMQQLTSAVQHNAANAEQANRLAAGASDIATLGVDVVSQVVRTMDEINKSSHKIGDIIAVIDDIAFQTNILALNAAVEAARAGEQGQGFAVVAVEVRNLAQRATEAAAEIKDLITDSVDKVSTGNKLVEQAGQTMKEIVNSIHGVTEIMAEITSASSEQSTGIEQVNIAIAQMDDVTQQNAALVEQAAAAAESLEEQARSLVTTVGSFKTGHKPGQSQVQHHAPATEVKPPVQSATANVGDWEEF
jgi:methyl-accepting chemotaxis protein